MIQKIGKYEVRGRIGRGGMGTVFRAHDPVLDRAVAIKVISDDVDVTEELRTRFFREAQACAKLSHPNIVTIYDMGEEDGRLYIVMEFLEGEELRHLIAQRRYTALEDKIALMSQVCDGLHYAHQKGVIHRDIKPGNIIVLRDGVAKIVDFGIAHVATLGGGLTRTGLVMGTLRYISPEQARGRADHRSDMFSVGSVFYEFLAHRPALTGTDPMHLLEQLRSEEPPALSELDPTVPLDLSAVIAKAMRKDPTERFVDLGQMRLELENVQLRLGNDAAEVRRSINRRLERARHLQTVLGERIGASASTVDLPAVEERARLDTLRAIDGELAARTQRLQQLLDKAERVSPALERGLAHLDARRFDEAIGDLEEVLGELPEHEAAAAALEKARQGAEKERRRRLVTGRLEQASAAFERGAYRECLGIVTDVLEEARGLDLGDEASGLRRAVEAAIAAQEVAQREETQRQRDRAESAMALLEEARGGALDVDAARRAESAWLGAESKAAEGRAALDRGAHVVAAEAFDEGANLYHRAEESARESIRQEELQRQRAQAERALQRMAQRQAVAQAIEAERWSADLWSKATHKAHDGRTALEQEAFLRAIESFEEATALFRRTEETARDAIKKEELERRRVEVEQARVASERARDVARAAEAQTRAPSLWQAAESRETAAQEAVSESAYTQATRLFGEAANLYADGERAAQAARRQEQEQAQQALDRVAGWRNQAESARAEDLAPTLWLSAEAKAVDGKAAVSTENHRLAVERLLEAEGFYRRAIQAAQTLRRQQQDEATGAQDLALQHRAAAARLDAAARSADLWQRAEGRKAEAESALSAGEYPLAKEAFFEAGELFGQAERAARDAIQREELARDRDRAQRAESAMNARRAAAEVLEAARRAASPWRAGSDKAEVARLAFQEARYGEALATFEQAATLYREAEELAREVGGQEERARQREAAERAREGMAAARARASEADAGRGPTAPHWAEAEARATDGRAALARAEYEQATRAFEEAESLYGNAERVAREAMRAEQARHQQRLAEQARDLMARRRALAGDANAEAAAAETWAAAVARAEDGQRAMERADYTEAARAFTTASGLFRQADDVARRAMEALDRPRAGQVPQAGGDESTILAGRIPLAAGILPEEGTTDDPTVLIPLQDRTSALPAPEAVEKTPPTDATLVAGPDTSYGTARAESREQVVLPVEGGGGARVAEGSGSAASHPEILASVGAGPQPTENEPTYSRTTGGPRKLVRASVLVLGGLAAAAAVFVYLRPSSPPMPSPQQITKAPTPAPQSPSPPDPVPAPQPSPQSSLPGREPPPQTSVKAPPEPAAERTPSVPRKGDPGEAAQAQRAAADARRDAERAQAPRLAPATFAAAQQELSKANGLLREDGPAAKPRFQEAQKLYRLAIQEAEQRAAEQRVAEQRATEQRAAEQRVAEQRAAQQRATEQRVAEQRVAEQRATEQRATEQRAAEQRATEQRAAEQRAAQQRVAALQRQQSDVDQSRGQMGGRRDQAVRAEADRLAKSFFDAAQAKHAEADTLASLQSYAAANQAYREATERYTEAATRAQIVREARAQADSARARMGEEKQRASRTAPEFSSAEAEEKQAALAYERLAYGDAADKFRAAGMLYARAKAPAPPAPPSADKQSRPRPPPPPF